MAFADRVTRAYSQFEKVIICVLLVLLAIMVTWATLSMAGEILTQAAARLTGSPPASREGLKNFFERFSLLREVFGGF
jgi:hypothetical protein